MVYAALGVFFFFLILFLQQVAGYSPLRSGALGAPGHDRDVPVLPRRVGASRPASVRGSS